MQWLVCLDTTGVLQQFLVGKDVEKSAQREKKAAITDDQLKVIFVFQEGREFRDDNTDNNKIKEIKSKRVSDFYKAESAFDPKGFQMYTIRKTTFSDYIEVLIETDVKTVSEFHTEFSGLEGSIDILFSAIKVMHPHTKDAGKTISKWIKKLELEMEV